MPLIYIFYLNRHSPKLTRKYYIYNKYKYKKTLSLTKISIISYICLNIVSKTSQKSLTFVSNKSHNCPKKVSYFSHCCLKKVSQMSHFYLTAIKKVPLLRHLLIYIRIITNSNTSIYFIVWFIIKFSCFYINCSYRVITSEFIQ